MVPEVLFLVVWWGHHPSAHAVGCGAWSRPTFKVPLHMYSRLGTASSPLSADKDHQEHIGANSGMEAQIVEVGQEATM